MGREELKKYLKEREEGTKCVFIWKGKKLRGNDRRAKEETIKRDIDVQFQERRKVNRFRMKDERKCGIFS